ncbi:hypothetical protein P8452_26690 [Trifolium repens]|nr:hypothetical protein P8452_26690 [Trifolium repens]
MTTQLFSPKQVHQKIPIGHTVPSTSLPLASKNNTLPLLLPVTVVEDPEGVENMDIQVERKRRREDEIKKGSTSGILNQHFLSAGPGSQDCREQ